uniref:Uncharacterized protein n=1 Tax=Cacopsylla melanoneura TaxID=428564 RepID=A0A8D9BF59_9HEMI
MTLLLRMLSNRINKKMYIPYSDYCMLTFFYCIALYIFFFFCRYHKMYKTIKVAKISNNQVLLCYCSPNSIPSYLFLCSIQLCPKLTLHLFPEDCLIFQN